MRGLITCFHRLPAGFSGAELLLFGFLGLVAFALGCLVVWSLESPGYALVLDHLLQF